VCERGMMRVVSGVMERLDDDKRALVLHSGIFRLHGLWRTMSIALSIFRADRMSTG
jgi:hypothetical protein